MIKKMRSRLFLVFLCLFVLSSCGTAAGEGANSKKDSTNTVEKKFEPVHATFQQAGLKVTVTGIAVRAKVASSFDIQFAKADASALTEFPYDVIGWVWMPMNGHDGHGGQDGEIESSGEVGHFIWKNIGFTMSGEWILHLRATTKDGSFTEEVELKVDVPR